MDTSPTVWSRKADNYGEIRMVEDEGTPAERDGEDSALPPAQQLIADIARGAVIGRRMAELRPARQVLGQYLLHQVNLYEGAISVGRLGATIEDIEARAEAKDTPETDDLEDRYAWDPWLPASQSPAQTEFAALADAGWPADFLQRTWDQDFGRVLYLSRRLIEGTLDHLRSIAVLLQEERSTRSPIALSRISLEASARAWHLLDPDLDPAERMFRCINAELDALDEQHKAARREDDEDEMRETGAEIKTMLRVADVRGANRSTANGRRLEPYLRPADMIDELLQREHHSTYHEFSMIIHSQEDEGFRIALGLNTVDGNPHQDRYVAMHVLTAILGFVDTINRVGRYTGWDFSDLDEPTQQLLTLWAHGAGLADDQYRTAAEQQLLAEGAIEPTGHE